MEEYFKKEKIAGSKSMEARYDEIVKLISTIFLISPDKAQQYGQKFSELKYKMNNKENILCKDITEIIDNVGDYNVQQLVKTLRHDIIKNFLLSRYIKNHKDINKDDLFSEIERQIIEQNIQPNTPIINQMVKMTSNVEDAMSIVDRYNIKVELVNLHLLLYKTNNIEEAKMILEKYSKDYFVNNDTHRVLQKKFPGQKIGFLLKPYRKKKE